ncbi:MAG: hypothetical protein KBS62_03025 [Oscillospiraceae bacterium]|nr:hypothetical protein [Candidatus Ruminococcus equi]
MNNSFNPFSKNISIIKNYFKRKNTLVIGISAAVQAIAYILLAFAFASLYTKIIDFINVALVTLLGGISFFSKLFSSLGISGIQLSPSFISANITPIISSVLPFVLFCGFFAFTFIYIFAKSRSAKTESTPKLGLDFAFVISAIQFALYIIAIIGIIALFFSYSFIITLVSHTSGIVIGIVLAILSAFLIALGFYRLKFYKIAKQSMECIEIKCDGAKVYAILETINTVFCGIVALSFVAEFFASLCFSAPLLSLIGVDFSGIAFILFCFALISTAHFVRQIGITKLAFSYNKYINDVRFGFSVDYEELKSVTDESFPVVSQNPVSSKVEFVVPKEKKKKKSTDKKPVSDEIKIKANAEDKEEKTETPQAEESPTRQEIPQQEVVAPEVVAPVVETVPQPEIVVPVAQVTPKQENVAPKIQTPVIESVPTQKIPSVEISSSVDESSEPENETISKSESAPKVSLPTTEKEDFPVCPSCKNKVKPTDLFCESCGKKLK